MSNTYTQTQTEAFESLKARLSNVPWIHGTASDDPPAKAYGIALKQMARCRKQACRRGFPLGISMSILKTDIERYEDAVDSALKSEEFMEECRKRALQWHREDIERHAEEDRRESRLLEIDFELDTASPQAYRDAQEEDYVRALEREREGLAALFGEQV